MTRFIFTSTTVFQTILWGARASKEAHSKMQPYTLKYLEIRTRRIVTNQAAFHQRTLLTITDYSNRGRRGCDNISADHATCTLVVPTRHYMLSQP